MKRRALLSALGAAGISALAGCPASIPFFGETTLKYVAVSNWDTGAGHTFGLRIKRDGSLVHESTHEVKQREDEDSDIPDETVDCTWDDTAGDYVVTVRVDGGEWRAFDVLEEASDSPDCVAVIIQYDRYANDELDIMVAGEHACDNLDDNSAGCPT